MKPTINLRNPLDYAGEVPVPRRERWFAKNKRTIVIAVVCAVIILYVGSIFAGGTAWRAVFLTNNQVYFGHFYDIPFAGTITLRDVYYLQLNQSGTLNAQDQSQLKLVKLGSEIHGPTGMMVIPTGQVLFWETLRDDSAIVKTIKNIQN